MCFVKVCSATAECSFFSKGSCFWYFSRCECLAEQGRWCYYLLSVGNMRFWFLYLVHRCICVCVYLKAAFYTVKRGGNWRMLFNCSWHNYAPFQCNLGKNAIYCSKWMYKEHIQQRAMCFLCLYNTHTYTEMGRERAIFEKKLSSNEREKDGSFLTARFPDLSQMM